MIPYIILSQLLLDFASSQYVSFSIKAKSDSILYDRRTNEYREKYKELVGMYPPNYAQDVGNGGYFIENIEVIGNVGQSDMGSLTVKIKKDKTVSSVESICGILDLYYANKGKHLLCAIYNEYDDIEGIDPRNGDTITFTDYNKVKKLGDTTTSEDSTKTSGEGNSKSNDDTKKNDTSTNQGIYDESDGESSFRAKFVTLILGLLLLK